jgi:hypothetical protein
MRTGTVLYIGTHHPGWLSDPRADFPLCVSRRSLGKVRTCRPSTGEWILDSGGFTELSLYGRWTISAAEYAEMVARFESQIGNLAWAAPMDMMCEPAIIHGGGPEGYPGTHLSVEEHQRLTVANYLELHELWPALSSRPCPIIPVLQGWTMGDYLRCAEMYEAAGIRLTGQRAVGIGSVCRRKNTTRIAAILSMFAADMPVHGFGITQAAQIAGFGGAMASADSMAWSADARRSLALPGHPHRSCANCLEYARIWRAGLVDRIEAAQTRAAP